MSHLLVVMMKMFCFDVSVQHLCEGQVRITGFEFRYYLVGSDDVCGKLLIMAICVERV